MLRVMMNDRCLRGPRTGVGHYAAELLAWMPRVAPDIALVGFYGWLAGQRRSGGEGPGHRSAGRPARPPWWLRRLALGTYNTGLRLAGRLRRCQLYHEPNHIPARWNGPVVTTVHDLSVIRHPEWHPADRVRWYERDFLPALDRSTHFITVSQFSRKEMVAVLGIPEEKVTVIPLGVRSMFHPRPAEEVRSWLAARSLPATYVLYVGTIEPRKNVPGLLAAYARLSAATRRQVPLLLAGVTGWGQDATTLVVQSGAAADVRPMGYVDEETLAYLYAGAKLLVWPTFYEGFGLPPLEAMASGTPVITSRTGPLPEVVGDAALLIDPRDEDDIHEAMRRVIADVQLAEKLRAKGMARSRLFSWERCAVEHASVYRRMGSRPITG